MPDFGTALAASMHALRSQTARLNHISENISNSDTPGYKRKVISFHATFDPDTRTNLVQPGPVRLDQSERPQIFDPTHPLANTDGYYHGSNVDLLVELSDAREARRSYEANLKMFDQTRQMSGALIDLLRK